MRMDAEPAWAISARTRSAPTFPIARSVAMLSLCAIMASSTERAGVVPARLMNTGLAMFRKLSSMASCSSSASRSASTSRRYCAEDEGLVGAGREKEEVAAGARCGRATASPAWIR